MAAILSTASTDPNVNLTRVIEELIDLEDSNNNASHSGGGGQKVNETPVNVELCENAFY